VYIGLYSAAFVQVVFFGRIIFLFSLSFKLSEKEGEASNTTEIKGRIIKTIIFFMIVSLIFELSIPKYKEVMNNLK
jgi:ABC-type transport system involved in cytochrome c biogenesis permease component